MSDTYRIIFTGEVRKDTDPAEAQARLAELLNVSAEQVKRLFARKRKQVLKRVEDIDEAKAIAELFARAGVRIKVEADEGQGSKRPPALIAPVKNRWYQALALPAVVCSSLLVALLYLLLPLGLIALLLWHLLYNDFILQSLDGGAIAAMVHGLPILGAGFFLLFLARPLLALRHPRPTHKLDPVEEDVLWEFANYMAEAVGAPPIKQLELDDSAELSVAYRNLGGRSLRLRLGLPLLAGLNTRQLGGAMAVELARYRGLGARLRALLHILHRSLDHLARRPDAIDRFYEKKLLAGEEGGLRVGLGQSLQRLNRYTRMVPRLFWRLNEAVVGGTLRRQRLNGERTATRLIGAAAQGGTVTQLRLMQLAHASIDKDIAVWGEKKRFASNLADAIAGKAQRLAASGEALQQRIDKQQAALPKSAPSDQARREAAAAEEAQPLLGCDTPGPLLLHDYDILSRRMTLHHYRNDLGMTVLGNQLVAIGRPPSAEDKVLARMFGGRPHPYVDLKPKLLSDESREDLQLMVTTLQAEQAGLLKQHQALMNEENLLEQAMIEANQAELLLTAGLKPNPRDFGIEGRDAEAIHIASREREAAYTAAHQKLAELERRLVERFGPGLTWLERPEAEQQMPRAAVLRNDAAISHDLLVRLGVLLPRVAELRLTAISLEMLLVSTKRHAKGKMRDRIDELRADAQQQLTGIRLALRQIKDPTGRDHKATLWDKVTAHAPQGEDAESVLRTALLVQDNFNELRNRALARLATLALRGEQLLLS